MQGHTVFTDNGFLKCSQAHNGYISVFNAAPPRAWRSWLFSIAFYSCLFFLPVFWIIKWHYVPQMMRSTNSFQILGRKVFCFFFRVVNPCLFLFVNYSASQGCSFVVPTFFERCYRIQSENTFFSGWNFSISTFAVIFDHFHLNRGVTWLPFCVYFHFIQQKVVSEVDLRWVCWITTWQRQNN